jgi:hypothetical protein
MHPGALLDAKEWATQCVVGSVRSTVARLHPQMALVLVSFSCQPVVVVKPRRGTNMDAGLY